jgi:hypothetical protein
MSLSCIANTMGVSYKKNYIPTTYYCVSQVCVRPCKKLNVKQSLYRPAHGLRVAGVWSSQISRQSAHLDGKVVSPTHQPPLRPRKYSWYSFLLEAESTPGTWCGRKDVNEKFQWHYRESNLRPASLSYSGSTNYAFACPASGAENQPNSQFILWLFQLQTLYCMIEIWYHNFGPDMKFRPSGCVSIYSNSR